MLGFQGFRVFRVLGFEGRVSGLGVSGFRFGLKASYQAGTP